MENPTAVNKSQHKSTNERLARDVHGLFLKLEWHWLPIDVIVPELLKMRQWQSIDLNAYILVKLLRNLELEPEKVWWKGRKCSGYRRDVVWEAIKENFGVRP